MGKIKSRVEFMRLGTIMIMLPWLNMLDMLTILAMFTIISVVTVTITDCFHTCVEKEEEEGVIGSLIQDNCNDICFNFGIVLLTRSVQNIVNVSYHGTNQRGEKGLERRGEVGQAWQSRKADTVPWFCHI